MRIEEHTCAKAYDAVPTAAQFAHNQAIARGRRQRVTVVRAAGFVALHVTEIDPPRHWLARLFRGSAS